MLEHGNFQAWISTEGAQNDVYSATTTSTGPSKTVSGWIASQPGKKFSIDLRNQIREFAISCAMKIDGVNIYPAYVMADSRSQPLDSNSICISFAQMDENKRRDFVFSNIQVTDDDSYLHTLASASGFGTITLELWKISIVKFTTKIYRPPSGVPTLETQVIHERSKKAGTHHAKFGNEYLGSSNFCVSTDRLEAAPFLIFSFRYRPLEFLIANGIAPRPVTPPRSSSAVPDTGHDDNGDTDAALREIQELEARLRVLRQRAPKPEPQELRLKSESGSSARTSKRPIVIDLTMDD